MTTTTELTKEEVKRLKFVNEAIEKNGRPVLGCVNFQNGVAAAADGYRAHIINLEVTDNDGNPLTGTRALRFAKNILLTEDEDPEHPNYPDISMLKAQPSMPSS